MESEPKSVEGLKNSQFPERKGRIKQEGQPVVPDAFLTWDQDRGYLLATPTSDSLANDTGSMTQDMGL